jgi:hypothetical protein
MARWPRGAALEVTMNELAFHHYVLVVAGVAGILEFFAVFFERHPWSRRKRVFLLLCAGPFYLYQTVNAFQSVAGASSLELFGFVGCLLGCLGAVGLVCVEAGPRHGHGASKSSEA